ncbi:hypothetical protein ACFFMN_12455 [Planobispora siamensis]|uniref:Ig-like domain (Group 3) n=1 Tax=Planobispora siamensis TaxID=936338 RepID=A0A8J3WJG8_9ACTN|nr:hypothetical protein [Planobispora siamensis]GIH89836.1 hypothetical protein Psi01_04660 [Planobispora siamensis]
MRFTKSLAAAGALGLAVLTASPALADDTDGAPAGPAASTTGTQGGVTFDKAPGPAQDSAPEDGQTEPEAPVNPRPETEPEAPVNPRPETEPEAKPRPESKPQPESKPRPEDKPQPEPKPESKPRPEDKPRPESTPPAEPKPAPTDSEEPQEPRHGGSLSVSPEAVFAGEKISYEITARDHHATEARLSSPALPATQLIDLHHGRATGTAVTAERLRPGRYPVQVEILLDGKVIGTASAQLFIKDRPRHEEPRHGGSLSVSPEAVFAGEKISYEITAREHHATEARLSSPALPATQAVGLHHGRATGTAVTRDDLKPGRYPVQAEILLRGKVIGTASAHLVIKERPVVKPARRLDLQVEPRAVRQGQVYYAGVTTENVEPGTQVILKDPGGRTHVARLDDWGTARFRLVVPRDTDPGSYRLAAFLRGGPGDVATLTVVEAPKPVPAGRLALALHPHTVVAGANFTAVVSTKYVAPGTRVTIFDPAGKAFTVRIGRDGVGARRLHVPSSTSPGAYWFTAKLPTGQKAAAQLTVKAAWRPSGADFTPRGGAQTGGGVVATAQATGFGEAGAGLGGLALGGALIAGGSGVLLAGRGRKS